MDTKKHFEPLENPCFIAITTRVMDWISVSPLPFQFGYSFFRIS
jgi:hypothetical protein